MKGFIEYLIDRIEEVESEIEQDLLESLNCVEYSSIDV